MTSLFAEMDICADALRVSRHDLHTAMADELRMAFRQLQKARMPELTREQAADLCTIWMDQYLAARMAESEARVAAMVKAIDAAGERDAHRSAVRAAAISSAALPIRSRCWSMACMSSASSAECSGCCPVLDHPI